MSTDEHRRHLVAMATDEPDSAAEVDNMLAALNQLRRLSAVSCALCLLNSTVVQKCRSRHILRNSMHRLWFKKPEPCYIFK